MNTPNKRRNFLKKSVLATGGALIGAPAIHAKKDGSLSRKKVVGHNGFTYEVDHKWAVQDPNQYPVQNCHEMVMDHSGRLIMCTTSLKNNILVFNKDGKVLNSWSHNLPEPHGLSIAGEKSDQTLWLTDSAAGRVLNITLDGRIIRELELPKGVLPEGKEFKPTETTVAPNGDVYVADGYGSNLIFHYDDMGQFKKVFGGDDHFNCAHGIVFDHRSATPSLLITSRAGNNFQRWTLDGKHLMTRELPGFSICRPVIKGDQTYFAVIVTKSWGNYDGMVAVLDKDFQVVSLPGGSAPTSQEDFNSIEHDGKTLLNPHDVCLDDDENIYVPQWYSGRTYPVRLQRV